MVTLYTRLGELPNTWGFRLLLSILVTSMIVSHIIIVQPVGLVWLESGLVRVRLEYNVFHGHQFEHCFADIFSS